MTEKNILPDPENAIFGQVVYSPKGRHHQDQRQIQLVQILNGSLRLRADGRWIDVQAGESCLLLPGQTLDFYFDDDAATEHTWMTTRYAEPPDELVELLQQLPPKLATPTGTMQLIELGLRASAGIFGDPLLRSKLATTMLAMTILAVRPGLLDAIRQQQAEQMFPIPVQLALQYMAEHLEEPLMLNDLARAAHVTPAHLNRLFRAHTDDTPVRRLWQLRTEQGIRLLKATGLNVTEIAIRCGFSSAQHFARMVKAQTGSTPRQLRRKSG